MPPRHYDLAALILASAVESSTRDGLPVDQALADAARQPDGTSPGNRID